MEVCTFAGIVNSQGQYLLSQCHPQKTYPFYWECRGGSVLTGEDSLNGTKWEVREELGIMLNPFKAEMIYHTRREEVQDFYDVWLLHADIDISEIKMQETEVAGVQWANRDVLSENDPIDVRYFVCYYESMYLHEDILIKTNSRGTECG